MPAHADGLIYATLVVLALLGGCQEEELTPPAGDDDTAGDAGDDDDSALPEGGDCGAALSQADTWIDCTEFVPDHDPAGGGGFWDFGMTVDCWAVGAHVEVSDGAWSIGGYDPNTGDPDECSDVAALTELDFGYDEVRGFWSEYHGVVHYDLGLEPVDPCMVPRSCSEGADVLEVWFCLQLESGQTVCSEH